MAPSDRPIPPNPTDTPIGPEGWGWFDAVEKRVDEQRREASLERDEIARHYAKLFRGRSGKIVADDLMRYITIGATFDPTLGFYNGAAFGFWREGQNSMVMFIKRMVEKGRGT